MPPDWNTCQGLIGTSGRESARDIVIVLAIASRVIGALRRRSFKSSSPRLDRGRRIFHMDSTQRISAKMFQVLPKSRSPLVTAMDLTYLAD
jgi:hypothetical protein